MFHWLRFVRTGVCAIYMVLAGGIVQTAGAAGDVDTNSPVNHWLTRTWQSDEGLPDNNVTGVAQTADGHLWVATLGGLMRFDGQSFEGFSTTHLFKVPNHVVRSMYLDRRGRLWLAMDRGVMIRVDGSTARVFDLKDGFPDSRVTSMAEDNESGVWFVCANQVCRVLGDSVKLFGAEDGPPTGGSISLAADAQGQLWFACGSQLGVLQSGRWQILQTLESGPLHLAAASSGGMWVSTGTRVVKYLEGEQPQEIAALPGHVSVQVMLEDHAGALWVGTEADGLLRLKGNAFEAMTVSHPDIAALTEDREGNLWVGTEGGGLDLLRSRAMELTGTKAGLPFDVASVCQDTDGWLWAVLENGAVARGHGGEWDFVSSARAWPGGEAACVTADRAGGAWIGTRDRGLLHWQAGRFQSWGPAEGLPSQNIRSMLQTTGGDLWLATDLPSRLWRYRDGHFKELLSPVRVRAIRALTEGADGVVWAGSSDGQILRIQGDVITNLPANQNGPPFSIRCLHTTPDGSLWVGYAGWGIGRWYNGHYARVTMSQGLYDDYVSQMLSDGQGGLWLTSNHGLSQVRLPDLVEVAEGRSPHLRANAYGRDEGLPSLQPVFENNPTVWRGSDGQLWFATRKGVLAVQPDKIRDNPIPPTVFVNEVRLDDQPVALYDSHFPLRPPAETTLLDLRAPGVTLKLPPRHTKVEFDFTALSFNSPENVQFRYRLKGFDTDWVEAGTQRVARFPHLPYGRYEFEVTACNEAGIWNKLGFVLPVIVQPFFWQTWWFDTLLVLGFTAVVITTVRYVSFRRLRLRMRLLEQQAALDKERARIAKDLHDDLGASMTQLTLVLELALQQRPEPNAVIGTVQDGLLAAREAIKSLDAAVWAVNPANNTLPELVSYIGQFAMEFLRRANIGCVLDLPDHPPERAVSAELRHSLFLIVKEALNNVVRHAQAGEVRLQMTVTPAALDLLIADDGRGIEQTPDDALADGLRNMRQRAEELNAQFRMESASGAGTKIFVRYFWPSPD